MVHLQSCFNKLQYTLTCTLSTSICCNNSQHTTDIALCERKNQTNLSPGSQRNEVVTTYSSYRLLLQIVSCELTLSKGVNNLKSFVMFPIQLIQDQAKIRNCRNWQHDSTVFGKWSAFGCGEWLKV